MTTLQSKPGTVATNALASWGLVAGGVAFFAGGAMHPREAPPDATRNETLRAMFQDPLWYPAHAVLLVGMALLTAALVSLVRSRSMVGRSAAAQRALVWAAFASALATVAMVLHLLVAVESDALARGSSTPLVSVHAALETINVPLLGLAVAALAAVGGATRALGNRVIAVPGVVGGLAYAAAGATIAFTDVLDPLFPLAGLIGVWAVAVGIWLLVRTRRSAAITWASASDCRSARVVLRDNSRGPQADDVGPLESQPLGQCRRPSFRREENTMLSRLPTWSLVLFGLAAIVLGVLGVTYAPPAVAKVFWIAVTVLGLASLALAHRTRRST